MGIRRLGRILAVAVKVRRCIVNPKARVHTATADQTSSAAVGVQVTQQGSASNCAMPMMVSWESCPLDCGDTGQTARMFLQLPHPAALLCA